MSLEIIIKIINSAGLCFDIVGACFVAWEVVRQFEGREFRGGVDTRMGVTTSPRKTQEFSEWELNKYRKMKLGLILLIIGFLLQMASNWTFLFS